MGVREAQWRTSLRWTEVFAWSRRTRPAATRLLDAQCPAFMNLALQCLLGGVGLCCRHHLNEPEATALAGVWILHDVALLDGTVLAEECLDFILGQLGVNAGDEEIGA